MLFSGPFDWPKSGSIRQSVLVEDGQLGVNPGPVLPPASSFGRDVDHRQVQHFQQTVVCRKDRPGFGQLPQLAVEARDGVGRVD